MKIPTLISKKELKRVIVICILAYTGLVAALVFLQRDYMYFTQWPAPDISIAPTGMNEISVTTSDDLSLKGWLYYPTTADKPVIIFFHGNAQTIEHRLDKADPYIKAGYGILMAEYRGYGGNPGRPTEDGLYNDARAYINFALKDPRIPKDKLVFYGESLGSGVATQMATEFKPSRLILEVPFSSALDVAQSRFFFVPFLNFLMFDTYDNTSKIKNINCPVLIGTAGMDFVVPNTFGKKLFDAANQPKKHIHHEDAMHHTMYSHGFAAHVIAFIESSN